MLVTGKLPYIAIANAIHGLSIAEGASADYHFVRPVYHCAKINRLKLRARDPQQVIGLFSFPAMTFDSLQSQYRRQVFNHAYRLTRNRDDAEDLTQATFVRALGAMDRLSEQRNVASFLMRVLNRLHIDKIRHDGRRCQTVSVEAAEEVAGMPLEFPDHSDLAAEFEARDWLERLTEPLSYQQRQVVDSLILGLNSSEAAERYNTNCKTARTRVHRLRRLASVRAMAA